MSPINIVEYSPGPGHSRGSTITSQMSEKILAKILNLLSREMTSCQGSHSPDLTHDGANSIWQVRTGKFPGTKPLPKVKVPNWYQGCKPRLSTWNASERGLISQTPLRRLKFRALNRGSRSHRETPEPSPIRSPLSYGCSRIVGDCGWMSQST